jgi:transposase
MAYREVSRMAYAEVVRRWQVGESQRAIARALGLARNTVAVYIRAASAEPGGDGAAKPLPRRQPGPAMEQPGPAVARLTRYEAQVARWLRDERLKLTRIQELLDQQGVVVKYTTLRRFVRQAGLAKAPKSTVRMAETAPGEVAEMDFGKLGTLVEATLPSSGQAGKRRTVWALVILRQAQDAGSESVQLRLAAAPADARRDDRRAGGGPGVLRRGHPAAGARQLPGRGGRDRPVGAPADARVPGGQPGAGVRGRSSSGGPSPGQGRRFRLHPLRVIRQKLIDPGGW